MSLAGRWINVCFALRLLPSHEDTIAKSCHGIPEDCLRKVLSKWLQRCYDTTRHGLPTWRMLVAAVANSTGGDNPGLAREIARNHPGEYVQFMVIQNPYCMAIITGILCCHQSVW